MNKEMTKEQEKKIQELQLLEQNLSNLLLQKQNFQARLIENENALRELEKTKKQPYKIIGGVMIAMDKEELKKDLLNDKELFNLRIKNIEKQENKLKDRAQELQNEILKTLNK